MRVRIIRAHNQNGDSSKVIRRIVRSHRDNLRIDKTELRVHDVPLISQNVLDRKPIY